MAVRREGPGFATLNAALKDLDGAQSRTGWFETSHYEGGTPTAYVAAVQEYGHGKIPPRLGMRQTVAEKSPAWLELMGQGSKAVIAGEAKALQVLEAAALRAAGDFAKHITEVYSPPLSLLTIALRKWKREHPGEVVTGKIVGEVARSLHAGPVDLSGVSTKPLIDTGQLLRDLTAVAEKTK